MKEKTAKLIFEGGKNAEMLEAIADITGKGIKIQRAGENSAGDVVVVGEDKRILYPLITHETEEQINGPWEMAYAIDDEGRISWAWLGHKILGPCYQCGADGKWRNCYSHGNFGKNYAAGGTWSGIGTNPENGGHPGYNTLDECAAARANDAKKLTGNYKKYAAVPVVPPKLVCRRYVIERKNGRVLVENETLRIRLPETDYDKMGRQGVFSDAMAALGNFYEVTQIKKEGISKNDVEMRYRKCKAAIIKEWEIDIIGEMPEQIGLCRYKKQQKRDKKGRYCK